MNETRNNRDWRTPLLLTLSLHLLVFTLIINHRMMSILPEPRQGAFVTQAALAPGEEHEPETGAEEPASLPAQTAAAPDVSELLREPDHPQPALPERSRVQPKTTEPVDERTLSQRLTESLGDAVNNSPAPARSGGAAALRGQSGRLEGLRRHGGGSDTEDAVDLGLTWLASVQDHDGRWNSDSYMLHYLGDVGLHERMAEGAGMARNDIGITGLCLMAFTGAGNSHREGKFADTVRRASDWLLSRQRLEDGGFGLMDERPRPTFYGHALATLALADLYLLTGDPRLRTPAQRAVYYLCEHQGQGGGWDYPLHFPGDDGWQPNTRNDLSISGWAALALVAAREAGLDVPLANLTLLVAMLREHTRADGEAVYANEGIRAFHRGLSMLAVSNLCRRLLGEVAHSEIQNRQHERIAANLPRWSEAGTLLGSNMYYWYHGSLALLLGRDSTGGEERWRRWNIALKDTLLPNQVKSGPRRGSFSPDGDYWARSAGGRLYSTAMCVLTLQVYYRYEPEFLRAHASQLTSIWDAE